MKGLRNLIPSACLLAILLLTAGYVASSRLHYQFSPDAAHFLATAKSLASGQGFMFDGRFETRFPPGLPLLLSPVSRVSGDDFRTAVLFTSSLCGAALLGTWLWLRRRGEPHGGVYLLLMALSPAFFLWATGEPMSEVPYLAASIAFLCWAEADLAAGSGLRGWKGWALGGLLLVLAISIRTVGISLWIASGATVTHLFLRRLLSTRKEEGRPSQPSGPGERRRSALWRNGILVTLMGVLFSLGWGTYSARHRQPLFQGEYMDSYVRSVFKTDPHRPDLGSTGLLGILPRVFDNVPIQAAHGSELLLNLTWLKPSLYSPLVVGFLLLTGAGLAREFRRPNPFAAWYLAVFAGILLAWPFDEATRFMVPILPLLFLLAGQGVRVIGEWIRSTRPVLLRGTGLAICLAGTGSGFLLQQSPDHPWTRQDSVSLTLWILIGAILLLAPTLRERPVWLRAGHLILPAYLAVFSLQGIDQILPLIHQNWKDRAEAEQAKLHEVSAWIRTHTPASATIVADEEAVIHYLSQRRTYPFPTTGKPEVLKEFVHRLRPDYLVVEDPVRYEYYFPIQSERLAILQRLFPGTIRLVRSFPGCRLFRFSGTGDGPLRTELPTEPPRR